MRFVLRHGLWLVAFIGLAGLMLWAKYESHSPRVAILSHGPSVPGHPGEPIGNRRARRRAASIGL